MGLDQAPQGASEPMARSSPTASRQIPGPGASIVERRNGPARTVRAAVASWFKLHPSELRELDRRTVARLAGHIAVKGSRPPVRVRILGVRSDRPADAFFPRTPERRDLTARLVRDAVASRCLLHPSALGSLDEPTLQQIAHRLGIVRIPRTSLRVEGHASD